MRHSASKSYILKYSVNILLKETFFIQENVLWFQSLKTSLMPTFVVTTNDDEVGIMTTLDFQWCAVSHLGHSESRFTPCRHGKPRTKPHRHRGPFLCIISGNLTCPRSPIQAIVCRDTMLTNAPEKYDTICRALLQDGPPIMGQLRIEDARCSSSIIGTVIIGVSCVTQETPMITASM